MKLNGKNIITDKDITITGADNLGDSLSDILQNQQTDINSLKSNVKWLYKYGGVGSGGSGGAGNSSGSWGIHATLGGRTIIDGGTISLNSESSNSFQLVIAIKNGNGNYSVDITYDDVRTGKAVLNPDNGWKTTLTLNLTKNSFINITVSDGSDYKTITSDYITNPYSFSDIKLVNDLGKEYQNINKDIFISDAFDKGLNFKIHYEIAIKGEISYHWEYLGITTEKTYITNNYGDILLKFPKDQITNDKAGLYKINCIINVTPLNQDTDKIDRTINFNLIPDTLYLKISPEIGTIYDNIIEDVDNIYSYKTSTTIGLILRAYYGVNQNQSGIVNYILYNKDNNIWVEYEKNSIPITENTNTSLQISFLTPGWKKLTINCTLRGETYQVEKFLYLTETLTTYNWYKKSAEPSLTNYYRPGSDGTSDSMKKIFGNKIYYQMFSSNEPLILGNDIIYTPTSSEVGDILISIGIQYNEINNINNPIAAFSYLSSGQYLPFCTIYQNKVDIENNEVPIFLGKTDISEFDVTKSNKYHLIQILLKHIYRNESSSIDYRQVCVYIDGTLEGAVTNWFSYTREISQVTLYPGNYSINLLEISNFSNYLVRTINDLDINYYYNTFKVKSSSDTSIISNEETSIIDNLYNYDSEGNATVAYDIENQLIKLNGSAAISQISSCVKIPSLVCKVERILRSYDNSGKTIFEWLNTSYTTEQDSNQEVDAGLQGFRCPTTLRWYNNPNGGGNGISFDSSKIISGLSLFGNNNTEFYLRLQGSSTMRYKSKNLTLGARLTSEESNADIPVFSPNFRKDDSSTFLPDNAFTLKADVVDSSHSNNTSLGKFINDIYQAAGISGAKPVGELRNHVKTCLEGFPILLFLEVSDESSGISAIDTEYYYLGVYNFNLGRENQLNLGYMDLNVLNPILNMEEPDEYNFLGLNIPSSDYQPAENLVVAEVQGNNPMWDFSQYHNSILFKVDGLVGDTNYMFGDIVYGSEQITKYKKSISEFVKSISAAGNYLFNSIGKDFNSVVDVNTGETISRVAYRTANVVPDADLQFIRKSDGKTYKLIERTSDANLNPTRDDDNFGIGLLRSCILETESGDDVILPYLDYKSVLYYYTICMAFGLVDSVQKNLNIKTWNGKTFGLYFYDMDTGLGTSNSGGDTSYFCFTDYWKTAITKLLDENGNEILDNLGNPVYKNLGADIYRDFYPEDKNLPSGYDIPSTYLFSIAKYAACFSNNLSNIEETVNLDFPQNIWGRWRSKRGNIEGFTENGILENSSKFITEYFEGHLKDIPTVLLNLNYRVKYLYNTIGTGFNDTDSKNLKGRQIEKVRDWLNNRFHILDAYFNLGKESVLINENKVTGVSVYEPLCNVDTLNTNIDIQVLHDIFSPVDASGNITTLNREGELKFRVKAGNYTPLIHKHANTIERFLLEDENTEYEINVVYNGNQTSKFGGSEGWTYLDSLNSFIQTLKIDGAFSLNTKRLEYIEGTEGKLTGEARLTIPSAKSLVLTSPNYSCKVKVDDSFYNLTDINISNSKIQLSVEGSKLTNIIANYINSEKVELISCNQLKNISLTGSTIKEFTVSPVWKDAKEKLDLTGLKTTTLNLTGKGGELIIVNSSSLVNITFSNFSKITITSCPNLKFVTCNDSDTAILKECNITGCSNVNSIKLISDQLEILNLNNCVNLSELELRKLSATDNTDILLEKLSTLILTGSKISRISRPIKVNNNWVDYRIDNILYITDYPNLNTFNISRNKVVEYIKFNNDKNNPFIINDPMSECTNLKRIFGHVNIAANYCFNGCNLFSIHGYYSDDENNIDLLTDDDIIKYNNIPVIDRITKKIYHPLEMGTGVVEEITSGEYSGKHRLVFQEGEDVTNISFSNTINLNSAFSGTSCTIFDIYYVFQNLENIKENTSASSCFYNISGKKGLGIQFNWDEKVDNSPNRYMFKDWGWKISSLDSAIRGRVLNRIRLYTTYEKDGEVIGGLFYYLPNITTINALVYGSTYYTDNKVFTSSTGSFNKLISVDYFSPKNFIDNINTVEFSDIFNSDGSFKTDFIIENITDFKLGNLDRLFNECISLTRVGNVINSTEFINYNKANICFPNTLKSIIYSFNSNKAIGKLDFPGMFEDNLYPELSEICQSFYVYNSFEEWVNKLIGDLQISLTYNDAFIELTNDLFLKFPNITNIGFKASGADIGNNTSDFSSFGGKLKKILKNGEFPFDIISNLEKLTVFTGFFRGCDTGIYKEDLKLPGEGDKNLFRNNKNLENISRCFQDIRAKIYLTPNSFSNCTKLNDVSYLFCNSLISSKSTENLWESGGKIGIISSIPAKFFYHGSNSNINKTLYGSNEVIEKIILGEEGWDINESENKAIKTVNTGESTIKYIYTDIYKFTRVDEYINGFILSPASTITTNSYDLNGVLVSSTVQQIGNSENIEILEDNIYGIKSVYNTIKNMQNCFQGQGWILPYDIKDNGKYELEPNPYYQPYNFMYDKSTGTWTDNTLTREDRKDTFMWSYDGTHISEGYHYIDEDINVNETQSSMILPPTSFSSDGYTGENCTTNFFCPPDLFRYSTEDVNITNIFNYTGYSDQLYLGIDKGDGNLLSDIKFGISGRICPYLLKPIPRVTSLEGFLTHAARLSYYKVNDEENLGTIIYLIPKTFFSYATKITNLSSAFKGFIFPNGCKLDVFDELTTSLNINYAFQYSFYHGTANNKFNLSNVFINNNISSAIATFSIEDCPITLSIFPGRITNQYISFGINFSQSKMPLEMDSSNYRVKHVYDGYSNSTVTFVGYNEETGKSTEFKVQAGKDQPPCNYRTR